MVVFSLLVLPSAIKLSSRSDVVSIALTRPGSSSATRELSIYTLVNINNLGYQMSEKEINDGCFKSVIKFKIITALSDKIVKTFCLTSHILQTILKIC